MPCGIMAASFCRCSNRSYRFGRDFCTLTGFAPHLCWNLHLHWGFRCKWPSLWLSRHTPRAVCAPCHSSSCRSNRIFSIKRFSCCFACVIMGLGFDSLLTALAADIFGIPPAVQCSARISKARWRQHSDHRSTQLLCTDIWPPRE